MAQTRRNKFTKITWRYLAFVSFFTQKVLKTAAFLLVELLAISTWFPLCATEYFSTGCDEATKFLAVWKIYVHVLVNLWSEISRASGGKMLPWFKLMVVLSVNAAIAKHLKLIERFLKLFLHQRERFSDLRILLVIGNTTPAPSSTTRHRLPSTLPTGHSTNRSS